jgi:hypothetical protein
MGAEVENRALAPDHSMHHPLVGFRHADDVPSVVDGVGIAVRSARQCA